MSQSDLRLHFGLGQAKVIELIEVKWPTTQKVETFKDVEPNQILIIKEGEGILKAEKVSAQPGASTALPPAQAPAAGPENALEPNSKQASKKPGR